MVVCLIALPVLLVLGLFSATHRKLAKEAINCAIRKVTFKPCDLSFEQKLKKGVFGSLMKRNEKLALFTFKHFGVISIIFGILMIFSLFGTAFGAYNLILFGNCNGPATSDLCVFNPETYSSGIEIFGFRFFETIRSPDEIKPIELGDAPSTGNPEGGINIIEVGCFTCPYTKATEPLVKNLFEKYGENLFFSFKYFPLPNHSNSFEAAVSAECAREQGKFWEYKEKIFKEQSSCIETNDSTELNKKFVSIANQIGLNEQQFVQCIESGEYVSKVELHKQQSITAGIYGTPTFFVNGEVLVAPTSIKQFDEIINLR